MERANPHLGQEWVCPYRSCSSFALLGPMRVFCGQLMTCRLQVSLEYWHNIYSNASCWTTHLGTVARLAGDINVHLRR